MTPASKKKRLMTLLGGADNKEKVSHKLCGLTDSDSYLNKHRVPLMSIKTKMAKR